MKLKIHTNVKYRRFATTTLFAMIENPSYDRVLADQEDKTKLPKIPVIPSQ